MHNGDIVAVTLPRGNSVSEIACRYLGLVPKNKPTTCMVQHLGKGCDFFTVLMSAVRQLVLGDCVCALARVTVADSVIGEQVSGNGVALSLYYRQEYKKNAALHFPQLCDHTTKVLFEYPMVAPDGFTYEKRTLIQVAATYFDTHQPCPVDCKIPETVADVEAMLPVLKSPVTDQYLDTIFGTGTLIVNRAVENMVFNISCTYTNLSHVLAGPWSVQF